MRAKTLVNPWVNVRATMDSRCRGEKYKINNYTTGKFASWQYRTFQKHCYKETEDIFTYFVMVLICGFTSDPINVASTDVSTVAEWKTQTYQETQ